MDATASNCIADDLPAWRWTKPDAEIWSGKLGESRPRVSASLDAAAQGVGRRAYSDGDDLRQPATSRPGAGPKVAGRGSSGAPGVIWTRRQGGRMARILFFPTAVVWMKDSPVVCVLGHSAPPGRQGSSQRRGFHPHLPQDGFPRRTSQLFGRSRTSPLPTV